MMRRARLLACFALLSFTACQDQQPLAPAVAGGPVFDINDGHVGGGNPGFFFLAPIRRLSDDAVVPRTGFNASLAPVIEVYECAGTSATGCVLPLGARKSRITMTSGTPLLNRLYVLPRFHEYGALWDTRDAGLRTDRTYRIQVSVGGEILGYADVDVVRTLKEAGRVDRDDFVPLLQNLILPIRFWIGDNALCTGTCTSKTITLAAGGTVELDALGEVFKFDIRAGTVGTSGDNPVTDATFTLETCEGIDVDLPKFGECLRVSSRFSAAGGATQVLHLSIPALVSMCKFVPAEGQQALITLHQQDGNLIRALPHASPNCGSITPSAPESPGLGVRAWRRIRDFATTLFTPQSLYAASRTTLLHLGGGGETGLLGAICTPTPAARMALVTCVPAVAALTPLPTNGHTISDFQFALPAKMTAVPGTDNQSAAPGTAVINPPAVFVSDLDNRPVGGATVRFVVTAGGGALNLGSVVPCGSDPSLSCVVSDVNGIARVGSWTLGTVAGTNIATASGVGIAAQNNYPEGVVTPFMPGTSPVVLGTGVVTFTATNGAADLVVESLTHLPADPTDADLIEYTAVVRNIGTAAAGRFSVLVLVQENNDGVPGGTIEMTTLSSGPAGTSLAPGASISLRRQKTLQLAAKSYINTATADIDHEVAESNEENNTATDRYSVSPALQGLVADATGDVTAGDPDLIAGAAILGEALTLRVQFAPGTMASTTRATFVLDIDRNPATGFPGIDAANNDWATMGVEYLIQMGSAFVGPTLRISHYDGTSFVNVTNSIPIVVSADGLEATIPLSLLGNDDGTLNYKVTVQRQLTDVGFTGILDYMPNIGLAPGMLTRP